METRVNANAADDSSAALIVNRGCVAAAEIHGRYEVECCDADGNVKWHDVSDNIVTTIGKNHVLDTEFAGSAYTVVGPFMGLISATSFTGVSAADTMASHAGWLEAGSANTPTYSGTRKTVAFSAAASGSKTTSAALVFAITGTGTVKGCFVVLGSGATNAVGNTGGTLYSAVLFSGGDKAVANTDTLNVSFTATLT